MKKQDVCCVGVHVQHATFVIALLSFIGSCILICVDFFNLENYKIKSGNLFSYVYFTLWKKAFYHVSIDMSINSALSISALLLLYGNIRLDSRFYWPFIGFSYVNIGICVLKAPLFMLAAVSVFKDEIEEVPKGGRIATCIQITLLVGLSCMVLLFNWYSVGVVTRAREFLVRHRQVRTESMKMEIKNCTLHLDGYQAPIVS